MSSAKLFNVPVVLRGVAVCFLFVFSLHAYAAIHDYKVNIDVPDELKDLLTENLEVVKWSGNDNIDRMGLRRLYRQTPDQIRKLLETEGYYEPEIESRMEEAGDSYELTFVVKPGQSVKVGEVSIEFTGAITSQQADARPDPEVLRDGWAMPEGTRFRQADWEAAKSTLLRQVMRVRYPRAKMTHSQATVDPEKKTAILNIVIDSGDPVFFGEVTIVGLERYDEKMIMRERPIKPGSVYREKALTNWQTRIEDTGYFRSVEVLADLDSGLREVPVTVRVVENKKRHAAVGLGYSTDTGNRVSLKYDDRQFLGMDMNLKSGLVLETKKQTAQADIYFPRTAGGFTNSVGAKYEHSDIQGKNTRLISTYGRTAWGRPRFEQYVTLEYLNENTKYAGESRQYTEALPLTYGFIKRELDNRISPTKGYAIQAELGLAVEPVLTDQSYLRPYLKAAFFHPFSDKAYLLLRGEAGGVLSGSQHGIPTTVMFRTGGDQSVRGYAYESLGIQENGYVKGGRYMAVGSIELQYYFYNNWGAAVFVDAGNVTNDVKDFDPAFGYGIGGRWRSPAGPLGVDIAYGEKNKEFRIHFSFGFTF